VRQQQQTGTTTAIVAPRVRLHRLHLKATA
jgi:hypothetical protein